MAFTDVSIWVEQVSRLLANTLETHVNTDLIAVHSEVPNDAGTIPLFGVDAVHERANMQPLEREQEILVNTVTIFVVPRSDVTFREYQGDSGARYSIIARQTWEARCCFRVEPYEDQTRIDSTQKMDMAAIMATRARRWAGGMLRTLTSRCVDGVLVHRIDPAGLRASHVPRTDGDQIAYGVASALVTVTAPVSVKNTP